MERSEHVASVHALVSSGAPVQGAQGVCRNEQPRVRGCREGQSDAGRARCDIGSAEDYGIASSGLAVESNEQAGLDEYERCGRPIGVAVVDHDAGRENVNKR